MIENWSTKKYNVIYADPPWSYYNDSTAKQDCTTVRGMRRPPYPVMGSKVVDTLFARICRKNKKHCKIHRQRSKVLVYTVGCTVVGTVSCLG